MFVDIIIAGIAIALILVVLLCKRHAGTMILTLLAGGFLGYLVTPNVAEWLTQQGVNFQSVPAEPAVAIGLLFLPVIAAWFAGPKGTGTARRVVGSIIFGIVGAALFVSPADALFSQQLMTSAKLDDILLRFQGAAVALGLGYALIDLQLSKVMHRKEEKHKK